MATTPRQLPDLQPAIDRLKAIVAYSGDRLLLADGPPNPDAALLDLCSEALHHLKEAEKAAQNRPVVSYYKTGKDLTAEEWQLDNELCAKSREHNSKAKRPMFRARKMRATTAAGIYAKALCVRCSRTGAAEFAMSLAEDLVSNPALRAALWPPETAGRA